MRYTCVPKSPKEGERPNPAEFRPQDYADMRIPRLVALPDGRIRSPATGPIGGPLPEE